MSGEKYSSVRLEEERRARNEALAKISQKKGELESFKKRIKSILLEIPDGIKESFKEDIKKAEAWFNIRLTQPLEDMDSTKLNTILEEYDNAINEGENVIKILVEVTGKKRDEKAKRLIADYELIKGKLNGLEPLIKKWKIANFEELQKETEIIPGLVEKGEFTRVERELNKNTLKLNEIQNRILSLEHQNEVRRYVLESLRKVCIDELGWKEEGEPHLEDENNLSSAIIYEVNTYSSGRITFFLRLEGIRVNSEIPTEDDLCYEQFNSLSESLKKYGIFTEFEQVNPPDEKPFDKVQKATPRQAKSMVRSKKH